MTTSDMKKVWKLLHGDRNTARLLNPNEMFKAVRNKGNN
jgi:hypothetical protein